MTTLVEEAGKLTQQTQQQIMDPLHAEGTALEQLVGEGKKFGEVEALAKGKLESDAFVTRLQTELAELREDMQGRLRMEEFIEEMRQTQAQENGNQQVVSNGGVQNHQEPSQENQHAPLGVPNLSQEEVLNLVNSTVNQREQERIRSANRSESLDALHKVYGGTTQAMLSQKVSQLGISEERLDDLAATSPAAFKELMGLNTPIKSSDGTAPPQSTLSTSALLASSNQFKKIDPENPKTMADFHAMRRTNPKRYNTRETQALIHRMAHDNPEEFLA